jgi:hypothetical protein
MIILCIVCAVLGVLTTVLSTGIAGPIWPLSKGRTRTRVDYRKINELEIELGIPPSDYTDKGFDLAKFLEEKGDETGDAIQKIERQLNPERYDNKIARDILSNFRVSTHQLGVGLRRFEFPEGDLTYHGNHGLSCPCAVCYGYQIALRGSQFK